VGVSVNREKKIKRASERSKRCRRETTEFQGVKPPWDIVAAVLPGRKSESKRVAGQKAAGKTVSHELTFY